jgi:parvulin-like peptidyl-prolyl isomerase
MRIEGRQVFAPEFLHVGLEFAFLARAQTLPEDPVLVFLAASCVGYNEGAPVERLIGCIFARDLLIEEARRRGLAVSDAEVSEELAKPKLPVRTFLQKDGVIDAEALRRYASSLGISETETRELVRRSVLARKAAEAIAEKASVSDEQAKAEYERQNTQVALELIEVPILPWVAKVTLSPEEIAKFAASNTDLVQAVFEERQMGQDAVRARHILIKCPKGAPPKEEEEAKAEAEAVYKRAQAGEDFAGLANETSDDRGSATNGGELGWFGRGMMVKEFEVQAFLRQPGEISPPFRSPFGYHILQVEEKRGALSLEQAAPKIAEEFAREDAAIAAAKKQAAELLAKAKKTPKNPFAKLLPKPEKDGPAVRDLAKTSLAALPEALTALKLAPDPLLLEAIAKLSPKDSFAPDAYLSGTSLVLVRLKEQSLPDPKGFTAQAEELKKTQLPKAKFDTLTAWLQSNATVAQSTVEPDPKVVLPLLELLGIQ